MKSLYPSTEANHTFHLPVDDQHSVYIEEYGNPAGLPVIYLHGGPGSGCQPMHAGFFSPQLYRIILLDQRGAGRSMPAGELHNNTTQDLIADLEVIRKHLHIEQWQLFAGSWGATLALLYAQAFPQQVSGMVLRGAFLGRQVDMEWYLKSGARYIYPEQWQQFLAVIPEHDQHDIIGYIQRCLQSGEETLLYPIAKAWTLWGDTLVLGYDPARADSYPEIQTKTLIELHYACHRYFIDENQILLNCDRINATVMPVYIIHGRRDLVCTPDAAFTLHQQLEHSTLTILPDAGHIAHGESMIDALVNAADNLAELMSE